MSALILYLIGAAVYALWCINDDDIKKKCQDVLNNMPDEFKKPVSKVLTVGIFIIAIPLSFIWPIWIIGALFKVISQKIHRS